MHIVGRFDLIRIKRSLHFQWRMLLLMFVCMFMLVANAESSSGGSVGNTLKSINVERAADGAVVNIVTSRPIGYRYTVYDSLNPVRIVIDLPGTDVSSAAQPEIITEIMKNVRVTPFELTSGKLGRIELILAQAQNYKVIPINDGLSIVFNDGGGAGSPPAPLDDAVADMTTEVSQRVDLSSDVTIDEKGDIFQSTIVASVAEKTTEKIDPTPGKAKVFNVEVSEKVVEIKVSGNIGRVESFKLGVPPRFVVDLFDVVPSFKKRLYTLNSGYKQLRVGVYKDKTRFVFDADKEIPVSSIDEGEGSLYVKWGDVEVAPSAMIVQDSNNPVTVEAVDFNVDNGSSILIVKTSGLLNKVVPKVDGNLVKFEIKNALISQLLKRAIDTSAFPSAVRLVTPYTVTDGGMQNVKFAVELKGPVEYSLTTVDNVLKMVVNDGPFSEEVSEGTGLLEVVTSRDAGNSSTVTSEPENIINPLLDVPVVNDSETGEFASPSVSDVDSVATIDKPEAKTSAFDNVESEQYPGQKISLVFDDADIRKILQLIGEVSELNILASDDVKGSVTLRLIDVPWDQALDLIMEIQGLGMIQQGNILRIMPREKITSMKQQAFTAARTQEKLENLVTEVISVSYTELGNISKPVKDILSARGKLAEDNRNKQLIITDIPTVITEVKRLVEILDTPERQVLIEARIVEANSSFSRDLGVSWGVTNSNDNASISNPSSASASLGGSFLITPATGQAGFGSSITFGRLGLDSTVLDLRIGALESSGKGKVVSSPRISTLNGVGATISSGTKIPYQSSDDSGVAKTEFVDANLSLNVTPVINPDNSVILTIAATNSSVGSLVGDAPSIDTKSANTTVLVKDGQTTVIGGIFIEQDTEGETGVPILSHLPLLGHLFKSQSHSSSRSELLIFITPRIIN